MDTEAADQLEIAILSPIHRIPFELLSRILSMVDTFLLPRDGPRLLSLVLVCRLWRKCVNDTPSLWCNISLRPPIPPNTTSLEAWLSHPRGHPLNLLLIVKAPNLSAQIAVLSTSASQIQTLSLDWVMSRPRAPNRDVNESVLRLLRLCASLEVWINRFSYRGEAPLSGIEFPKLRTFVSGRLDDCILNAPGLQRLEVTLGDIEPDSRAMWQLISASYPELKELKISRPILPTPLVESDTPSCQNLVELQCHPFSSPIVLPLLKHRQNIKSLHTSSQILAVRLGYTCSHLTNLTLESDVAKLTKKTYASGWFSDLPNLLKLTLISNEARPASLSNNDGFLRGEALIFDELSGESGDRALYCPKLKHIRCRWEWETHLELLLDKLLSLSATRRSILSTLDDGDYPGHPSVFKAELALLARSSEQLHEVMEYIDANRDRYYPELELHGTGHVLW